jgi:hypothetical protein
MTHFDIVTVTGKILAVEGESVEYDDDLIFIQDAEGTVVTLMPLKQLSYLVRSDAS